MFAKVVAFLALVAVAAAADLSVGKMGGRLIFYKNFSASPAIWKQVQSFTVNATDDALISRVVVIDNRPEKDGEAKVVGGGEGHNNVTIELKSPTVFRGFDFTVKVYAKKRITQAPQHPVSVGTDIQVPVKKDVEDPQEPQKDFVNKIESQVSKPIVVHPAVKGREQQEQETLDRHAQNH